MDYYGYEDDTMDTEEDVFMDELDVEEDDEAHYEDVDEMLDALMDDVDEDEDLAERRRRRKSRRGRRRSLRPVRTAKGRSAYRSPVMKGYVTQKQLKTALSLVGTDVRRNATGIKTVNKQLGRVNSRLGGVVTVNRAQSRQIGKLNRIVKMDGALEFAESYNIDTAELNLYQIFKGAVKSGLFGDTKGSLSNPLVVGGIGLLLNNPGILGGVLGGGRTS